MVKELSAKTGIKKHTLDNYLNTHNSLPNIETGVKIAQALGVTAEYLVSGQEENSGKKRRPLLPELEILVDAAEKLNPKNRRLAIKLVRALWEQEQEGK